MIFKKIPPAAKDLISRLLQRIPSERIGAGPTGKFYIIQSGSENDFSAIKNHEFFKGIDFNALENQTPPEMPVIEK